MEIIDDRMLLQSDHVLFCGDGALEFAKQNHIEEVDFEYLVTEKARKRLQNFPKFVPCVKVEFYEKRQEI